MRRATIALTILISACDESAPPAPRDDGSPPDVRFAADAYAEPLFTVPAASKVPLLIDAAAVTAHALPAEMACEENTSAMITMHNIGSSTWTRDGLAEYALGYAGDAAHPFLPMQNTPRVLLEPGQAVAPGESARFLVSLRAPLDPGSYDARFQMVHEGRGWFGEILSRVITVTPGCTSTGGCPFPRGVPEAGFIATASEYTDTDPEVDEAVNAVMESLTGCGVRTHCPIVGYPGANVHEMCQSFFAAVNQRLRDRGLCAGLHEEGSTDEIAVSNRGCAGKWYGYHVCNYGGPTVVWNPGARRGWWQIAPEYCD